MLKRKYFLGKILRKNNIYTHTRTITLIEYMILEKLMATCLLFSPHSVENINFVLLKYLFQVRLQFTKVNGWDFVLSHYVLIIAHTARQPNSSKFRKSFLIKRGKNYFVFCEYQVLKVSFHPFYVGNMKFCFQKILYFISQEYLSDQISSLSENKSKMGNFIKLFT